MKRIASALTCLTLSCAPLFAKSAIPAQLQAYIDQPDSTTKSEVVNKLNLGGADIWHIKLQSQTWHDIEWTHDLIIARPSSDFAGDTMVLINSGGEFNFTKLDDTLLIGVSLAQTINCPVAILLGVPNQPLYGGLTEDDLIAETFVRYLKDGDASWPLLFPMVKSLVKGMDTIQTFTKENWTTQIEKFIVAGASKRGWTTWLTAAADSRVCGIVPIVIDILNMQAQLPHQIECFGAPSEQIEPYTKRGLIPIPEGERPHALWEMIDPYNYREKYTMPKMLVMGNNDRYWTVDALNLYWEGIPGPKYISYIPNAGHDLTQTGPSGQRLTPQYAINNIAAFIKLLLEGENLPQLDWKHGDTDDGQLKLDITSSKDIEAAKVWYANSESMDFRNSRWESIDVDVANAKEVHATHEKPAEGGYWAYYGAVCYKVGDLKLWLNTQIRVVRDKD